MLTPAKKEEADWRPDFKSLYMLARNNGWSRQGVHDLILANFGRTSTKDLTQSEYEKTMTWLEKLPPNTITGERDPFTLDLFE